MGRECRVHGGKPVKKSCGKHMKILWMVLCSFYFILQGMEEHQSYTRKEMIKCANYGKLILTSI